jgi:diguanylate cyclase (GGDEF)-like protein
MVPAPASPRRLWRLPSPVWGLNALLASLAVVVFLTAERHEPALVHPHIAWWQLALGFALAERCVVHLHLQRHAHSFSLGDIPLVLGLLFCTPGELVAATVAGSLLVLTFDRRLPPIKLVFNLALFAMSTTVAVWVLHLLAAPSDTLAPETAAAALAAVEIAGIVSVALISAAISLSEGRVALPTLRDMFGMDFAVTATNASVGLLAALVLMTAPWALVLLLVPATTVFGVYRAYMQARQRHDRLEFLYEANRTLARHPEAAETFQALLGKSLEAFRAESAELILYSAEHAALRTSLTAAGEREIMRPTEPEVAEHIRMVVGGARPVAIIEAPTGDDMVDTYLRDRGVTHGMVAVLGNEDRVIGTLMIANRFGVVRAFDDDDLDLFETLAGNASVALQNDRLEQAIGELRVLKDRLHHQAYHDPLTGLPNRSLFHSSLRDALRHGPDAVAVLFIDVDDFKTVNDSLGHAVGDELLRGVAERLRGCVRQDDLVARLGGDEFAILLVDARGAGPAANGLGRRIMEAFEAPIGAGEGLVSVHLSVGIATYADPIEDEDALIRNADVAMYQAKLGGKGRFEVFDPAAGDAVLRRHTLKEELARALERDAFEVHFQPIVEVNSGRTVAVEALLRWRHAERGLIPPAEFIPLAEETGTIIALGGLVLDRACRQAAAWGAETPIAVHINVSAVEVRDPDLPRRVSRAVERYGIAPANLVLEITESQLLHDAASVQTLEALRATGVRLALDDFGTGYSSLASLASLPLDILKIPKPFVDRLAQGDDVMVRTICHLAGSLGLDVVAEGVETQAQLDALADVEPILVQGFHLARPAPARELDITTLRPRLLAV